MEAKVADSKGLVALSLSKPAGVDRVVWLGQPVCGAVWGGG